MKSNFSFFLVVVSVLFCVGFSPEKKTALFPSHPTQQDSLKIELGRILFYDVQFSADKQTSCASCHSSYHAFAHTDHALSHGNFDSIGNRNAPPLFNLAWRKIFMRDGAIHRLDLQALAPLHSSREMGGDIDSAIAAVNQNPFYRAASFAAWGDSSMNKKTFLASIAAFENSLISMNALYDRYQLGQINLNEKQRRGEDIFMEQCIRCHTPPLFQNENFYSVWDTLNDKDLGRFNVTQLHTDRHTFMTASLRNLGFTYPYGHDGRFNSLRVCIESHYIPHDSGREVLKKILNEDEITAVISFLQTLNDTAFVFNKQHQFPRNAFLIKTR